MLRNLDFDLKAVGSYWRVLNGEITWIVDILERLLLDI